DPEHALEWLEAEGFVREGVVNEGEHPAGKRRTFRTGSAFERLLVFEESSQRSRSVLTDARAGPRPLSRADFVRESGQVVVVGRLEREWFIASAYTEDPKCSSCGSRSDWNEIASEWYESWNEPDRRGPCEVSCSACASRAAPWEFDWQGTAAFA